MARFVQHEGVQEQEVQGLHDFLLNIKLINTAMTRKGFGMNTGVDQFTDDSVTYI